MENNKIVGIKNLKDHGVYEHIWGNNPDYRGYTFVGRGGIKIERITGTYQNYFMTDKDFNEICLINPDTDVLNGWDVAVFEKIFDGFDVICRNQPGEYPGFCMVSRG